MKNLLRKCTRVLLCSAFVFSSIGASVAEAGTNLDVDGDINLTGTIKTNMQAGTEGQILQTVSDGSIQWVDTGQFQNFKEFTNVVTPTLWTVPAGVTRIMVELWGGGGAGNAGGGGGSGGYGVGYWPVIAGDEFTITVGRGGSSSFIPGDSQVVQGSFVFTAYAGSDATPTAPGSGSSGGGANFSSASFQKIEGENGYPTRHRYQQAASTTYLTIYEYGNGGASPLRPLTAGQGGVRIIGGVGGAISYTWRLGRVPGGGGGGWSVLTSGGAGKVIIYW